MLAGKRTPARFVPTPSVKAAVIPGCESSHRGTDGPKLRDAEPGGLSPIKKLRVRCCGRLAKPVSPLKPLLGEQESFRLRVSPSG